MAESVQRVRYVKSSVEELRRLATTAGIEVRSSLVCANAAYSKVWLVGDKRLINNFCRRVNGKRKMPVQQYTQERMFEHEIS